MYLRFDSVGGASGDMLLGCLADLGADLDRIEAQVRTVLPEHFHIRREPLVLQGLRGTRVTVDIHDHGPTVAGNAQAHAHNPVHAHVHDHGHDHGHDHNHVHWHSHGNGHSHAHGKDDGHHEPGHPTVHRNLPDIVALFEAAPLPERAKRLAVATFHRLAEAEATVHGLSPENVHFHEVGAVDAIVDILGCCLALDQLGVTAVSVGPLTEGEGTFRCAHGIMPIPAPATAELLRGHPVLRVGEPFEMVTPTGAALLMTWKTQLPAHDTPYTAIRNGLGFGQRTMRTRPNLIRGTLADPSPTASDAPSRVLLLETNLDDCPAEWMGNAMERLLAAGALDVWFTPVHMKKNRPGTLLSVLCEPSLADALKTILFTTTTTFGLREIPMDRTVLHRRMETVETRFGPVRLKIGTWNGTDVVAQPEFEDCRALAERHGVAVREVHGAAKALYDPAAGTTRA